MDPDRLYRLIRQRRTSEVLQHLSDPVRAKDIYRADEDGLTPIFYAISGREPSLDTATGDWTDLLLQKSIASQAQD